MKKVLILTYDFPPYVSVGGQRPYSWYKYFKDFYIYPVVVTRQWSNKYGNNMDYINASESDEIIIEKTEKGTIIRTPYFPNLSNRLLLKYGDNKYRRVRKIITAYYEILQWYFNIGPKIELYKAAKNYLRKNKIDALIATGDPFITFKYASKLSREYNVPWIADYRDPWVNNASSASKILSYFYESVEKRVRKNVSMITTVSSFVKRNISAKDIPVNIIMNGFDEDNLSECKEINQNKDFFTISFAGTVYDWHPWKSVLGIFNDFLEEYSKCNLKINLYGVNREEEIKNEISLRFDRLKNKIFFYSKLSNNDLLKELASSNILLLFNDYSILGTKIFDYLAVKRSIILCYSSDKNALELKSKYYNIREFDSESRKLQEELINETKSGYIIENENHLKNIISELYMEFENNSSIYCNSINIEKFSRKIQARNFTKLIEESITKQNNL